MSWFPSYRPYHRGAGSDESSQRQQGCRIGNKHGDLRIGSKPLVSQMFQVGKSTRCGSLSALRAPVSCSAGFGLRTEYFLRPRLVVILLPRHMTDPFTAPVAVALDDTLGNFRTARQFTFAVLRRQAPVLLRQDEIGTPDAGPCSLGAVFMRDIVLAVATECDRPALFDHRGTKIMAIGRAARNQPPMPVAFDTDTGNLPVGCNILQLGSGCLPARPRSTIKCAILIELGRIDAKEPDPVISYRQRISVCDVSRSCDRLGRRWCGESKR